MQKFIAISYLHFSKQEEHGIYKKFEKLLNFSNLICFFEISGSNVMTTFRIIVSHFSQNYSWIPERLHLFLKRFSEK